MGRARSARLQAATSPGPRRTRPEAPGAAICRSPHIRIRGRTGAGSRIFHRAGATPSSLVLSALLEDDLSRTSRASGIAGIRSVFHAKDQVTRDFHDHFGFAAPPTVPLNLDLLVKETRPSAEGP